MRRVVLRVEGRGDDHYFRTLLGWCRELKDFFRDNYGVELVVEGTERDLEVPRLYVEDELAAEGVPGEEGFLIEIILSRLRRRII